MSDIGDDLIQALGEAVAHAKGEGEGIEHDIEAPDVKRIRAGLQLNQEEMATLMGVSASGYRKWEQGQRAPTGAARTLLKVMEREPEAVMRAVARA